MNILFLSDDARLLASLKKALSSNRFHLFSSRKKDNFYALIQDKEIKTVILDLKTEEIQDFALLRALKNFDPLLEVIIIGIKLPASQITESIKLGAREYLIKPLEAETLQPVLESIQKKSLLREETFRLEKKLNGKYIFHGIVSKTPHMLDVFSLIERMARYPVSVLITGETGTGKELVARAIHNLSSRQNNKLVICDCTAIPETLFESELFGYLKGAFTGADKTKDGLFQEADGGTIFLDEIGEIPTSIQAKLLRAIEEHQFRPLGSNTNVNVDIQVLSATSRDLREHIEKGTFREDLLHRINTFEIKLPPLKKRKEDIPLLSRHFLEMYNQKYLKTIEGISQRAQKILLRYPWPGNVRELENTIERAVMLCQEKFLDIKDLPVNIREYVQEQETSELTSQASPLKLAELEKRYILDILRRTKNNKQKAAKILGLNRQTLYRKLKRHNIPL